MGSADPLPDDIEPMIRGLCEAISSLPGIVSRSSCQGHTRAEIEAKKPYHGCALKRPHWYVSFGETGPEAQASIVALLRAVGRACFFSRVHGEEFGAGIQYVDGGEYPYWYLSGDGGHAAIRDIELKIRHEVK